MRKMCYKIFKVIIYYYKIKANFMEMVIFDLTVLIHMPSRGEAF